MDAGFQTTKSDGTCFCNFDEVPQETILFNDACTTAAQQWFYETFLCSKA